MSKELDRSLESLHHLLWLWRDETDPEAKELRRRASVEALWQIAMDLPVPEWAYLHLPGGVRICELIGSEK